MTEIKRFFVDRRLCMGCKTCELRCAVERGSITKNLVTAVRETVLPRSRVYVHSDSGEPVTLHCRQCDEAPCVSVCSTGALQIDPETGVKFIDADKCINCWMCVMACPYGVIAPAIEKHAADKCDRCFQMEQPYCMAACPTGAIQLLTPAEIEEKLRKTREETIND
ncbi:MAG: 4Fe-4S dicluster domain-containing protein [Oscillospiraceae bacterium]